MSGIPIIRTLGACTRAARNDARIELAWNIGIAFVPVMIVAFAVVFSTEYNRIPRLLFDQVGRGELMIYAAAICGPVLYSLRYNMKSDIPDSLKDRVTPIGTLTVSASIAMAFAMASYLLRRLGEMHDFPLNENLLYVASWIVLAWTMILAYVVFSLKHSLSSGATEASREQTEDFQNVWQQEGRNDAV